MGTAESEKAIAQQKIDDDSLSSDSDYDGCRGRLCSSSRRHMFKDILRGILVLAVLGIIVAVIFLLCFYLIKEKKDDKMINELIDEISEFDKQPSPKFSIGDQDSPPSNEVGPARGDTGHENEKLLDFREHDVILNEPPRGEFEGPEGGLELQDLHSTGDGRSEVHVDPFSGINHAAPMHLTPEDESFLSFGEFVPVGVRGKNPVQEDQQEDKEFKMAAKAEEEMRRTPSFPSLPEPIPGLGFDFDFDKIPPPIIVTSQNRCDELRLPLCAGSMPWAMTSFPNWVNNTNRGHLYESLQYFQSVIVGSQCSPRALEYTCAILEPPCGQDEVPLPPCRQFCRDVASTCREFLMDGHSHNGVFECEIFPDSEDPSVCVNVKRPQSIQVLRQPEPKPEGPTIALPNQNEDSNQPKSLLASRDSTPTQNLPEVDNNPDFALTGDVEKVDEHQEMEPKIDTIVILPEDETVPDRATLDLVSDIPEDPILEEDYPLYDEPLVCDHSMFLCDDGSDCITYDRVCNGVQECLDSSDEFNCTEVIEVIEIQPIVEFKENESTKMSLSKRPSLSEMVLHSAIVAKPGETAGRNLQSETEQTNVVKTSPRSTPKISSEPSEKSFSVIGDQKGDSKMTLADLLSSSVAPKAAKLTSRKKEIAIPQNQVNPFQNPLSQPQRSLSHILSSSLPSFSTRDLSKRQSSSL